MSQAQDVQIEQALEEALQAAVVEVADPDKANTPEQTEESKTEERDPTSSRIFLMNGDKLKGTPEDLDPENRILFNAESLQQAAAFPLEQVLRLQLGNWKMREYPATLARIQLWPRYIGPTTSDTITGALHELSPEHITLKTWYGGLIPIKRSMVKSLRIINNSPGSYFGPNNIKEWTLSSGKGSWQFSNGALASRASGGIGRDMKLGEKSHISFDLSWTNSTRFRMLLYSNDLSSDRPNACYDITLNGSYCYLQTKGKAKKGVQRFGGGRWPRLTIPSDSKRVHFDIFANRKTGTFTVYINGVRGCLLQSTNPDPEDLGTNLSFVAEERHPIEISGLTITPWNGTSFPNSNNNFSGKESDEENEDDGEEAPEESPHNIILTNGDEVPGTVGKVEDGRMIVETEYTPIKIPIKRIKSLSLGDEENQPIMKSGDVRCWFHQGGFITLQLKQLKDGKLSGYSQAFGDVTLDLEAFHQIDFHIYDREANQRRSHLR